MRAYRKRQKAVGSPAEPFQASVLDCNPSGTLAAWALENLKIPAGHPDAGQPFAIPPYGVAFLKDVFDPAVREVALIIARKNAKSAIVAALLLAMLTGPLRRVGFRAGVASLNKAKANELKMQMESIKNAAGLHGVKFLRSPAPGRVETASGSVDILSADGDAGAASGFDLAIVDEIGLLEERNRDLVNGLRSSVSARDGKFLSLSVFGSGPFVPEILERHIQGEAALRVHLYQADADAALDDEAQWHKANPGLSCGVKSLSYMRDEAARVATTLADQPSFRALDLNIPGSPDKAMLVAVRDWLLCEVAELPPRDGPCYVGIDLGGSVSMTAAVAYWPLTRRLETFAAFPDTPGLAKRGEYDGAGQIYERAAVNGDLVLHPGRVVNAGRFVGDTLDALAGSDVRAVGCDRFRKAEAMSAFEAGGLTCPVVWRGTGASATADGSADVRAFQTAVVTVKIQALASNEVLRLALSETQVDADPRGNPALSKAKSKARIDLVQAGVIALGLAASERTRKPAAYMVA